MAYINSKKYGSAVQLYHKANGDTSYSITYKDEDNKLKRIKIGDKSKGITEPYCNQKRNEVINSVRLGTDVPIKHKKQAGILFDTIAQKYFDDLQLHSNENTIRDRKNKYNKHLYEIFGKQSVDRIKSDELEDLQKEKIKTLSPKTVNQLTELFSTIFNYGTRKELCKVLNPATRVKRFKVDNTRERFLAGEEIKELFEALKDNEVLTSFVKFALTTGGRLETILHIQKKDVDLATKTLTLYDFKNKDSYKSFLTDDVLNFVRPKLKDMRANDYFVSLDGEKFTARQLQSRLKPKIDELFNKELETDDRKNRVVIHTLRHTFASHLAIQGTPIFTIQNLMNHKDIKQTMRYAKLAPDSGRNFVNDLYT
jgi:site-specific recombinase XerD